jgi:hypothetical protein
MMKAVMAWAAIALVAANAFAALGTLVGSFPAPWGEPRGLAISGSYLYVIDDGFSHPSWVYLLNPTNGSIASSFPCIQSTHGNNGLAYVEGYGLFEGCTWDNLVYRVNPTTGSLLGSWSAGQVAYGLAPYGTGEYGAGATALLDYSNLSMMTSRVLVQVLTTGSVVRSFTFTNNICRNDIAYDWRNGLMWLPISNYVWGYNAASGSLVRSFTTTAGNNNISAAYAGEYLYVGTGSGSTTRMIWKYHCPANLTVAPASIGSVKALFR